MKIKQVFGALLIAVAVLSCTGKQQPAEEASTLSGLKRSDFKSEVNGDSTDLYVLKNANGMEVTLTNYGARIVSVMVPDKNDTLQDVVLGFDSISDYVTVSNNFGATIGRYGNRINQGKIKVAGVEYQLPQNNFGHCLHGGDKGFDTRVFAATQPDSQTVVFTYLSADGEEGFPGNLQVKVTMNLTDDNAIDLQYEAQTDKETVVNLTNHSYFNLSGNPANTVLDQLLTLNADEFTPVDSTFMTTGKIAKVEGTPMDFRTPTVIGERIDNYDFDQLKNGDGYDHNWVLNTKGDVSQVAATVYAPSTGIRLDVYTTEPGLQVYSGNFLDGSATGKKGIVYNKRTAICLESQKFPDSPNKPQWPSPYVKPGETYTSRCIYKFSVAK
ncbi:MAG TPA: galactose-1-epimerase [Porphyromonadaceae bacterium]|jgi:aldose 1-epimerase|uniref:aldose epimerase family protein n=1 Tax=Limibacterium fermenti TaxID=3229863 RepID=UPI000E8B173F|nr:galactose-1-epimerase [Porphyromonadaceae bacterium]HBK31409.1 galactose-1-epimerase [Porphyromonadaceae bacterium]HBL32699.1 galactose-1-epimerase [Porphyromonadaceae bacterium]HBX21906.1 galactose-1-epimerase [Porphyromonadaceae bacterium]HBX45842.1 galactose-1-epimerase [Porphyromonadaceae bacterium]